MTVRIKARRGQALMELAIGMFITLVILASTFAFVKYINTSLKIQNHLRSDSDKKIADKVDFTKFEQESIFGVKSLKINEPVGSVDRMILQ